jgi:hypothetical protein
LGRISTVRWFTSSALLRALLEDTLNSKAGERGLNDELLKQTQERRASLEKAMWRLAVVQAVLLLALFLNAVPLPAEISIGGLSLRRVDSVKELLLFVTSSLSMVLSLMSAQRQILSAVVGKWLEKKYSGNALRFAKYAYGDLVFEFPEVRIPAGPFSEPLKVVQALRALLVILWLAWFVFFIVANTVVTAVVILDVAKHPALPLFWSRSVVVYAAIVFFANVVQSVLMWAPMPYRDYRQVHELMELQKRSKDDYEARLREITGANK